MPPETVLLTHPLPFGAERRFPTHYTLRRPPAAAWPDRAALAAALPGCRGLVCLLTDTIDAALIDAAPDLQIIANVGVGFNNIDWAHARERGIAVTNTPGALTEATADLTLALLLAAARRVVEADRFVRDGRFAGWDLELLLGLELNGATLGIVGLGRIGQAVARRARGFGMRIVYHNRSAVDPAVEAALEARRLPLDELLRAADVVSLHCPLGPATRHLIDARALAAMKPGAILINTARGPVVDEAALVDALRAGRLRAAGLDVYEGEPAVHPGLLALDNVVLLPHIGSATETARRAIVQMAVDNVIAFFDTGRPLHPVY
ncbi:MAG TPA: D-glycerate dehydrogenase [Acidobacteriota bacterium]|nr:D-glycerate dehydrogenase [Acidobacteriota bacterium]